MMKWVKYAINHAGGLHISSIQGDVPAALTCRDHINAVSLQALHQVLPVCPACTHDGRISRTECCSDELRYSIKKLLIVRIKQPLVMADNITLVPLKWGQAA